jgi:uncharacterized protein (TIGR03437 family)
MLMWRIVLVAVFLSTAHAAPVYTADSIVNTPDYATGPFAPNSILSLFGSDLSWSTAAATAGDYDSGYLPRLLGGVSVYVNNIAAPLYYVSPAQINFLVPSNLTPGPIPVRVVRQGLSGPEVALALLNAAPALFDDGNGYALAQHGQDYTQVTASAPAVAGETIVVYATGLGRTEPNFASGAVPNSPAKIVYLSQFSVYIDETPVPAGYIGYAGVTPGCPGLYQINMRVPEGVTTATRIRVEIGGRTSKALRLAAH